MMLAGGGKRLLMHRHCITSPVTVKHRVMLAAVAVYILPGHSWGRNMLAAVAVYILPGYSWARSSLRSVDCTVLRTALMVWGAVAIARWDWNALEQC